LFVAASVFGISCGGTCEGVRRSIENQNKPMGNFSRQKKNVFNRSISGDGHWNGNSFEGPDSILYYKINER